jgi:hypothetical protein
MMSLAVADIQTQRTLLQLAAAAVDVLGIHLHSLLPADLL